MTVRSSERPPPKQPDTLSWTEEQLMMMALNEVDSNKMQSREQTSGIWAFNFALGYFVPHAFINIRWKTYLVFAIFCTSMTIHVFFMFTETAGKPLEEVTEMFEDPTGIKYIGTPAWKTRSQLRDAEKFETGEASEKKLHDDEYESPERHARVEPAKMEV